MKHIPSPSSLRFSYTSIMATFPLALWQIVLVGIPLLLLAYSSLCPDTYHYGSAYSALLTKEHASIILYSLTLAFATAVLCAITAYPLTYHLLFHTGKYKNILFFLLMLPFSVNMLVQVYAWLFILDTGGPFTLLTQFINPGYNTPICLSGNSLSTIFVMTYIYFPFMVLPIYSTLEKFDGRLLDAAGDLGATSWQKFLYITLPLTSRGVASGFLLVFVPCFGEFIIPQLIGGAKQATAGMLISQYFIIFKNFSQGAAFTIVSGSILCIVLTGLYYASIFFMPSRRFLAKRRKYGRI